MEDFMKLLRRKSHILYDMNCIEKYIKSGDCDQNLEQAWADYVSQLKDIESTLNKIRTTELAELEDIKLNLLSQIREYESKIVALKNQLKDVERVISNKE